MRGLSVVLLALVACDMRWDGKKTNGQVEEQRETRLTAAEVDAPPPPIDPPYSPPRYQDEATLWQISHADLVRHHVTR